MILLLLLVITSAHWTQEHLTFPVNYCEMAKVCVHDNRMTCATTEDGCSRRTFLDQCDMYEYNCDYKADYQETYTLYCFGSDLLVENPESNPTTSRTSITCSNPNSLKKRNTENCAHNCNPSTQKICSIILNKMTTIENCNNQKVDDDSDYLECDNTDDKCDGIRCERPVTWITTIASPNNRRMVFYREIDTENVEELQLLSSKLQSSESLTTEAINTKNIEERSMISKEDNDIEHPLVQTEINSWWYPTKNPTGLTITPFDIQQIAYHEDINKNKETQSTILLSKTISDNYVDGVFKSRDDKSDLDLRMAVSKIPDKTVCKNNCTIPITVTTATPLQTMSILRILRRNDRKDNTANFITTPCDQDKGETINSIEELKCTNTSDIPEESTSTSSTKLLNDRCGRPRTWETTVKGETRDFYRILAISTDKVHLHDKV